jgi:hypothetical protein
MRNGILRDVIFACAGVFMVVALIGLPRPAAAFHQQWQMQYPGTPHLLPCLWVNPKPPPPGQGPAAVRPHCQKP